MKYLLLVFSATLVAYANAALVPAGGYLPGLGSGALSGSALLSGAGFGADGLGGVLLGGGINGNGNGNGNGHGNGNGLVHGQKQIHFYAAPEEYVNPLRIYVAPRSSKNTRIIFVKAPTYGSVSSLRHEIIAPASHIEDKTTIYVLSKKPESGPNGAGSVITIPSTITTKSSKPEIYFLKYKTDQEAEQAIASGLQDGDAGPSASEIGSAQSFINNIKAGILVGGIGSAGASDASGSSLLGGTSTGILNGNSGSSAGHGPVGVSGPY